MKYTEAMTSVADNKPVYRTIWRTDQPSGVNDYMRVAKDPLGTDTKVLYTTETDYLPIWIASDNDIAAIDWSEYSAPK